MKARIFWSVLVMVLLLAIVGPGLSGGGLALSSSAKARYDGDGPAAFDPPVLHAAAAETPTCTPTSLTPTPTSTRTVTPTATPTLTWAPPPTDWGRVYLPLIMKRAEPLRTENVTFAIIEGVSLTLDAYLPQTLGPNPAVILVHGGYWQSGDKADHVSLGKRLAAWGYAAFAINYRLAPEFPFPAAPGDVQCAVAWVREHATKYHVDPDRIAVLGTSAGGHLAALAGLAAAPAAPPAPWQSSCGGLETNLQVQGIISCYGPLDLPFYAQEGEEARRIVTTFLGRPCHMAPDLCRIASPIFYAVTDAPPTLLIHGTADEAVSYENSERMYTALQAVGVEVTYLAVEGAGHGFISQFDTPESQIAMGAIQDFLADIFETS